MTHFQLTCSASSLRRFSRVFEDAIEVTIDQWIQWPFPCGADDAWKFFMR